MEKEIDTKVVERANELLLEEFKAETSNEVYEKEGMNIEQAIETIRTGERLNEY